MNTRIKNLYNQEQETDKLTNLKRKDMMHQMPKLPYEMEALAPLMSKETFRLSLWKASSDVCKQPE